ncbi:MAG: hypothetical protein CMB80_05370 [Flammeovirgaceae bacterium]|nr:hypothetical protein [Flammeovirgaceae bacterium]MAH32748.1 hypothetical protein [Marinobacter sp.]|tara:strand:- start:6 stop:272 length:267 start_codon:yes stop_codon:yes gene_type:complete
MKKSTKKSTSNKPQGTTLHNTSKTSEDHCSNISKYVASGYEVVEPPDPNMDRDERKELVDNLTLQGFDVILERNPVTKKTTILKRELS